MYINNYYSCVDFPLPSNCLLTASQLAASWKYPPPHGVCLDSTVDTPIHSIAGCYHDMVLPSQKTYTAWLLFKPKPYQGLNCALLLPVNILPPSIFQTTPPREVKHSFPHDLFHSFIRVFQPPLSQYINKMVGTSGSQAYSTLNKYQRKNAPHPQLCEEFLVKILEQLYSAMTIISAEKRVT